MSLASGLRRGPGSQIAILGPNSHKSYGAFYLWLSGSDFLFFRVGIGACLQIVVLGYQLYFAKLASLLDERCSPAMLFASLRCLFLLVLLRYVCLYGGFK
jgi:hypothetical protein